MTTDYPAIAAELRRMAEANGYYDCRSSVMLAAAEAIEELSTEVVNAGAIVSRYETENARLKHQLAERDKRWGNE